MNLIHNQKFNLIIMINILLILSKILFPSISYANDGAWSGTGGGNGIACFEADTDGSLALDENGVLKTSYRKKIKELFIIDYWEHKFIDDYFDPEVNEDPKHFLLRVLKNYWVNLEPTLIPKLIHFIELIEVAPKSKLNHIIDEEVHKIDDYKEIGTPIPSHCEIVGIFNRYIKSNGHRFPNFFLHGDIELYEMLKTLNESKVGILNQAQLILHEALYIIGDELGLKTSFKVRNLSRFFLIKKNLQIIQDLKFNPNYSIKLFLAEQGFDLYPLLYKEEYKIDRAQQSRQNSYQSLLSKMNLFIIKHLGLSSNPTEAEINEVSNREIYPIPTDSPSTILFKEFKFKQFSNQLGNSIAIQASPEEAFLFYAMSIHALPNTPVKKNFNLLIDNINSPIEELNKLCGATQLYPQTTFTDTLIKKVKDYCINELQIKN